MAVWWCAEVYQESWWFGPSAMSFCLAHHRVSLSKSRPIPAPKTSFPTHNPFANLVLGALNLH